MTKVDVLDGFEFIKVGVGYRLDGEEKPTDWPPGKQNIKIKRISCK